MFSLYNFAGPLLGSFFGVLGAFYTQNFVMKKRIKLEKEEEKKRKKYILEILKAEIEHDIALLKQISDEYREHDWVGYYDLDTTTKQAVWSELIKMEADAQFVTNLARTYYELEHMNRKLDFQLNASMYAVMNSSIVGTVLDLRRKTCIAIIQHVPSLSDDLKKRVKEVQDKLSSLS